MTKKTKQESKTGDNANKSNVYKIKKTPAYSAKDIKRVRKKYNYSQKTLAILLNVSVRTVENWEISKSKPSGSASRLLELLEKTDFINILKSGDKLKKVSQ